MRTDTLREIKKGDWIALNQNIRNLNERLSKLDGFSGTSMKHSITHMESNKILSGPPNQRSAESNEFITKAYLRSPEAALIYSRTVGDGGISPIVLSPSQPGTNTVGSGGGAGAALPPFIVYGGGTDSIFTDFTPGTRQWIPVWGNDSYSTLDITSAGGAVMNFSISGVEHAQCFCGVVPRFKLFPDQTTKDIKIRAKFENISWSTSAAIYNSGPIYLGIFLYDADVDITATFGCWAAYAVDRSLNATNMFIAWPTFKSSYLDTTNTGRYVSPMQLKGPSPITSLEIAVEYTDQLVPGSATDYNICQNEIYYNVNNAGWNTEGIAGGATYGRVLGYQNLMHHGVNMFVGLFGEQGTINATLTEFAVEKGILGYSF